MLLVIIAFFIGRAFFNLSDKFEKNNWLYAILGALSYFIGQDLAEDKGFALAPYIKVRWENEGIITDGNSALAMGNYFFTKTNGEEVKVEYSFGYIKTSAGDVKINLHHSSLPFSPK